MKLPLLLVFGLVINGFAIAAAPPPGKPPVVVKRTHPQYPYALRMHGNSGQVEIEFVVDTEGNVRDPKIIKSSHPEFEAPAIEALLKWEFKPGIQNGRVVNTRMRQPITFALADWTTGINLNTGGVEPFRIPKKAPKELPPEFRYDKAPRPIVTGAPVYPFELLEEKIEGSATVAFLVDPTGHTRQVVVRDATRPEFGAAAAAMISVWEFEPAQTDGKPSWAMLSRKQVFDRSGRDSPVSESTERLLKVLKKNPSAIVDSLRDLDRAPTPRYQPGPVLPESMRQHPTAENAEIAFIIDRAGRAQLPRIISASREEFGWAAATAVARWQFNPPTKGGKPVDVKAIVPVTFDPPDPGAAPPAPEVPHVPSP